MSEFNLLQGAAQTANNLLSTGLSQGLPGSAPQSVGKKTSRLLPEYACIISCAEQNITFVAALPPDFDWSTESKYDTPFSDFLSGIANAVSPTAAGIARASGLAMVTQALTAQVWSGSTSGAITLPLVLQAETDEVKDVLDPLIKLIRLNTADTVQSGGLLRAPGPSFDISTIAKPILDTANKVTNAAGSTIGSSGGLLPGAKTFGGQIASAAQAGLTNAIEAGANMVTNAGAALQKGQVADFAVGAVGSMVSGVDRAAGSLDSIMQGSVRNRISLKIGNYMFFDNVVITGITQKHFVQPVGKGYGKSTGNMQRVELGVTFEPFFQLTHSDIRKIFINGPYLNGPRES